MVRVLVFGAFDPLHDGHHYFFRQARQLGDYLTVVAARDVFIQRHKHPVTWPQERRLAAIQSNDSVDAVILGDEDPTDYSLLKALDFDILALGYDQSPSNEEAKSLLAKLGKTDVRVVRIDAYKPDVYKSSLISNPSATL